MRNTAKLVRFALPLFYILGQTSGVHAQRELKPPPSPKPRLVLKGHTAIVSAAAFSPDGKTIASGSNDKSIKLWDVATGKNTSTFKGSSDFIKSVAFSPDGKTLASAEFHRTIRIWNVATGENTDTVEGQGRPEPRGFVVFSPIDKILATVSENDQNSVILWDMDRAKKTRLEGHLGAVNSATFSPDGKTVATSSLDDTIRLWEVTTGNATDTLPAHPNINCVTFHPNRKMLAFAGRSVWLWDLAKRDTIAKFDKFSAHPNSHLAFSPDGKVLASDQTGLWDVATGKEMNIFGDYGCSAWSFSPDGRTIATLHGVRNVIQLWDMPRDK
jgi:WD40 repeat protein